MQRMAQAVGATDWNKDDTKVSASRLVLYAAFVFVAVALTWAGYRTTIGGQPYAEMQEWVKDVVSGAKWFIAPYGAGVFRDAVASRGPTESLT